MDDNDLSNYLGDTKATYPQRDEMIAVSNVIDLAYPGDDDREENMAAFSAAVEVILGDSGTDDLLEEWRAATHAQLEALARMRGALAVEVARTSELAVSQRFGISRPTVRKAVGK